MKLWLDDLRDPDELNIQEAFGAEPGMVWVKTAREAIAALKSGNVSYISFDHDLGAASFSSGYDIAKWIEQSAWYGSLTRLAWTIHTQNPVGRARILAAMTNADLYWGVNHEN